MKYTFHKAFINTFIIIIAVYMISLNHIENFSKQYDSIASVLKNSLVDSVYTIIITIATIMFSNYYFSEKEKENKA